LFLTPRRPAPPTTLFPYTTLFRSPDHDPRHGAGGGGALAGCLRGARPNRSAPRVPGVGGSGMKATSGTSRVAVIDRIHQALESLDRKSTRLNSSHLGISYAVFCLK